MRGGKGIHHEGRKEEWRGREFAIRGGGGGICHQGRKRENVLRGELWEEKVFAFRGGEGICHEGRRENVLGEDFGRKIIEGEEKVFAFREGEGNLPSGNEEKNVFWEEFRRRIMYKRRKMEWERIFQKGKRRGERIYNQGRRRKRRMC